MKQRITKLDAAILEEQEQITLGELCRACSVHAEKIIEYVEEGIIEPSGMEITEWRFTGKNLIRARTALRLQRDLAINSAGVALALDLLEEIKTLQERLALLHND